MEQLGPGVGDQEKENPNMFLVGATYQRLLSGAEEVGLFKEYNDGSMRGFTCANKHNFTNFKGKVQDEAGSISAVELLLYYTIKTSTLLT